MALMSIWGMTLATSSHIHIFIHIYIYVYIYVYIYIYIHIYIYVSHIEGHSADEHMRYKTGQIFTYPYT